MQVLKVISFSKLLLFLAWVTSTLPFPSRLSEVPPLSSLFTSRQHRDEHGLWSRNTRVRDPQRHHLWPRDPVSSAGQSSLLRGAHGSFRVYELKVFSLGSCFYFWKISQPAVGIERDPFPGVLQNRCPSSVLHPPLFPSSLTLIANLVCRSYTISDLCPGAWAHTHQCAPSFIEHRCMWHPLRLGMACVLFSGVLVNG